MNQDRIYYSRDAELQAMRNQRKSIALFLVGGLATGAAIALLFAPNSGKETREDLAKSVEEGIKTGREAVEPAVKNLEKEISNLGKTVEERVTME